MAAPTPAEIKYQIEHIHENRSPDIIASHVICFALACIAVTMRFISRRIGKNAVRADDWLIVAALVSPILIAGRLSVNTSVTLYEGLTLCSYRFLLLG